MNVIDLFCGCGGFSLGAEKAGFSVVYSLDVWQPAVDTHNKNFIHPCECNDIHKVSCEDVSTKINNAKIDIIIGGPPCQSFSMAGRRDVNDPRGKLFYEYVRFVKYFNPRFFIMENVPGILTMKDQSGGLVKDNIIKEFADIGYNIVYSKLLASEYGVPQNRRRVFFIGYKKGENPPSFPQKRLPKPPVKICLDHQVPDTYYHSEKMIQGFNDRKQRNKERGVGFGAQYLDLNKPSYTISARYWKDGADALVRDGDRVRMLTEREVARIQTFPDTFQFSGTKKDVYTQIGNAVPCELAYTLLSHIKTLF